MISTVSKSSTVASWSARIASGKLMSHQSKKAPSCSVSTNLTAIRTGAQVVPIYSTVSPAVHAHPPQRPPSCPNLLESLCMAVSLFPQPIEVKITVGCESAEWLYISKITGGIYQCHWDTPTGMNWVKWEQCIGQGPLTVTNAPPMATNRSVQIAKGL